MIKGEMKKNATLTKGLRFLSRDIFPSYREAKLVCPSCKSMNIQRIRRQE